jgi:hypothetical protein
MSTRLEQLYALRRKVARAIIAEEAKERRYRPAPTVTATDSEIRDWARAEGIDVNPRGRLREEVRAAYVEAHRDPLLGFDATRRQAHG